MKSLRQIVTRLLVVDDSALMRKLLTEIFGAEPDFHVETARDGTEAIAKLHSYKPDVVTLDVHMPGMDGIACLDRIMLERPTPVVMLSALTEEGAEETLEALSLGAVDFAPKPAGPLSLEIEGIADALVAKVRQASKARVSKAIRLSERLRRSTGQRRPLKQRSRAPQSCKDLAQLTGQGLVLVGTSTGGPAALDKLLMPLPQAFAWPILIAQHMPATVTGSLARRLDRLCALQVQEVVKPQLLEPGYAYVGRGDADLIVTRRAAGVFAIAAPVDPKFFWHPSVDRLVGSALDHVRPAQIVGVLMTGMGNDGADAMTRLHGSGGITIAEDEESAVVWGMPGALVKNGGASLIAPTSGIAAHLLHLVGTR
jgi:two-component system, chemotaxis family, protein-glutamate methylesterase/glutaminase